MKGYLWLVATLLVAVTGYQGFAMMRWTPSIEALSRTTSVRAPAQFGYRPSGGHGTGDRPLRLDGRLVSCGPGLQDCVSRFHDLRDGEMLDADLVHLPDGRGGLWLAMSLRRANGDAFANSPRQIVDAWASRARSNIVISVLAGVFFLLVLPACASARFRQAWWTATSPAEAAT